MNLGPLCQIILKSDKEISGYGQLAQHAIFAYHMVRQTQFIALLPLRFLQRDEVAGDAYLMPLGQQGSTMYSRDAKEVRQMYQEYFTSSYNEVPWQWNIGGQRVQHF